MLHDTFRELFTLTKNLSTAMQRRMLAIGLCIALISILLAACGTSTASVQTTPTPTPTQVLIPTPSPTLVPTPKPTLTPTPKPKIVPTSTPTPTPVPASPAELELRPMGLSGHADCTKTSSGGYVCAVVVSSLASAQSDLHWFATTNLSGIGFSPAGSVLGPGQNILVRISIPAGVCGPGLFFFHGPINTHSTSWVC